MANRQNENEDEEEDYTISPRYLRDMLRRVERKLDILQSQYNNLRMQAATQGAVWGLIAAAIPIIIAGIALHWIGK